MKQIMKFKLKKIIIKMKKMTFGLNHQIRVDTSI